MAFLLKFALIRKKEDAWAFLGVLGVHIIFIAKGRVVVALNNVNITSKFFLKYKSSFLHNIGLFVCYLLIKVITGCHIIEKYRRT